MLKVCSKIFFIGSIIVLLSACKTYLPIAHTNSLEKVNKSTPENAIIKAYYQPYKDSLDKIMKIPIAELTDDITKKMPESTLGNLMADILKIKTQEAIGKQVDFSVMNYGGIRMASLTKGTLNIEHAFLLMPFDNYLTAQYLSGKQVQDFCDSIAVKGGWPVSGLSFQIKDKKAIDVKVKNIALDNTKMYLMATNDYVANGGDGMAFLKTIPAIQTGKLFREAIIEYWKEQTAKGNKISSILENRISYAK